MGMNLQSELDPLLTKLWDAAQSAYLAAPVFPDADSPAAQDSQKAFNEELASLVVRFGNYYSLDGPDLDSVWSEFAEQGARWENPTGSSVYSSVARAAGDVDDVTKLVHTEQWVGQAATTFKTNFLDPFKNTAAVHAAGALELSIAAKALADGVQKAKESVVWICKDAIERFGGGGPPGPMPGEREHQNVSAWVAILADAVAFCKSVAAPEFEFLDWVDGMLAGTGMTFGLQAESKTPGTEKPIEIASAPSPMGYIYETWLALNNLDANIAELDDQISGGLGIDLSPSGPFGSAYAKIQSPGVPSSAYQRLAIKGDGDPDGPHDPSPGDVVVRSIVRLYYAGYRTLPAAATEYGNGVNICSGARFPLLRSHFPRSGPVFDEAVKALGSLLSAVQQDLTSSGTAVAQAALNYQAADEEGAQLIKNYEINIPPPGVATNTDYTPPPWLEP
jgi:hypothetical protein